MKKYNFVAPIEKSVHTLIAGTTGSGKSVLINDIIYSLCASGEKITFIFCDPKRVELSNWRNMTLTSGFYATPRRITNALRGAAAEMEKRYLYMQLRGLKTYDGGAIYIIIDEIANLMLSEYRNEFLRLIQQIANAGRAADIHIIAATQSPSRVTIPAALTLDFDCRIALRCESEIESRQIIGTGGAEFLPRYGRGIIKTTEGSAYFDIPLTPEEELKERAAHFKRFSLLEFLKP